VVATNRVPGRVEHRNKYKQRQITEKKLLVLPVRGVKGWRLVRTFIADEGEVPEHREKRRRTLMLSFHRGGIAPTAVFIMKVENDFKGLRKNVRWRNSGAPPLSRGVSWLTMHFRGRQHYLSRGPASEGGDCDLAGGGMENRGLRSESEITDRRRICPIYGEVKRGSRPAARFPLSAGGQNLRREQ